MPSFIADSNFDDSSKKVLIIAYLFPPIGGGGVQRALKMAKYLVQFDWEVHVLTVEPAYHVSLDPSLLNELPEGVFIHRTKELSQGKVGHVSSRSTVGTKINLSFSGRMKNLLRSSLKFIKPYILVPDDQILWYPWAVREGLKVMSEHKIDVIFSTSAPYTNHLIGLYLKRKTGKSWIADFRDPWTQNMHRTAIRWREWLEDRLERMVLRESDVLLTVTPSFAANFKQKFSAEIKRTEVIHNGFDPDDYRFGKPQESDPHKREVCTFIYTGIFYKERNPRLFLKAIKQLMDEGALPSDRIRIQFAGVFDYPGYCENTDYVYELGLERQVEILGHLPHRRALEALQEADILIMIGDTGPDSGSYIPGKLYEYMAIGHPILALSLPGESTQIIEKFHLGEVVDPSSVEQIKSGIVKLHEQWSRENGWSVQGKDEGQRKEMGKDEGLGHSIGEPDEPDGEPAVPPSTRIYERKEQAGMLAKLMEELASST